MYGMPSANTIVSVSVSYLLAVRIIIISQDDPCHMRNNIQCTDRRLGRILSVLGFYSDHLRPKFRLIDAFLRSTFHAMPRATKEIKVL